VTTAAQGQARRRTWLARLLLVGSAAVLLMWLIAFYRFWMVPQLHMSAEARVAWPRAASHVVQWRAGLVFPSAAIALVAIGVAESIVAVLAWRRRWLDVPWCLTMVVIGLALVIIPLVAVPVSVGLLPPVPWHGGG
jgi:hypothetical protein